MKFRVVKTVIENPKDTTFLIVDNWDDFTFKTSFFLVVFDGKRNRKEIGAVKIGFKNQEGGSKTMDFMPCDFRQLKKTFFSLGQDIDYYQNIRNELSPELGDEILRGLNDIAFSEEFYKVAEKELVFKVSLLRDVSLTTITGQFRRVLDGGVILTNFNFLYEKPPSETYSGIELGFGVRAWSKPSTNIHAIIGRNGAGKTMLLNDMIESITKHTLNRTGVFLRRSDGEEIEKDFFSRLVSVSFSAFDNFNPPRTQPDPSLGTCYHYVGLKKENHGSGESKLKTPEELREELSKSLISCVHQTGKRSRWLKAILTLQTDLNFAEMRLERLADSENIGPGEFAKSQIPIMSSGHCFVLLTITRLVETVEEKTLVLIDEPESHLHPPLLSAFIRALSELLFDRNGVAIVATHSPVVLQEIPKDCVWKMTRSGLALSTSRPEIETFGENVGILTREVFGLEVTKSGFHSLLEESVEEGMSFEQIMDQYRDQLGLEAQAVLRAMLLHRDNSEEITQ